MRLIEPINADFYKIKSVESASSAFPFKFLSLWIRHHKNVFLPHLHANLLKTPQENKRQKKHHIKQLTTKSDH